MRVGRRTVDIVLLQLALTLALLFSAELVLVRAGGVEPQWVVQLFPAAGAVYAVAGLVAWYRRPANRMGAVMIGGAAMWAMAGLANTQVEPFVAVGLVTATLPLSVIVHLLLAFPGGRLASATARTTVIAGYVVSLVLQAPQYLFVEGLQPPPFDVLAIDSRPALVDDGLDLQRAIGATVVAATAVILVRRWRDAPPAQRRVVAPLSVLGIVTILSFPLSSFVQDVLDLDLITMVVVQLAAAALIPVAFTIAVLRGGFTRTGELEDLASWLGAAGTGAPGVVSALRRTLGDPTVELLYWLPERGVHVDAAGAETPRPTAGSGRAVVDVERGGEEVGAITYDPRLIADADVVRTAGRLVALAIDHERLTAELRASREALRETLARVVEAGDAERRRIARDLHDGIQAQCVMLSLRARQLPGGEELAALIDAAAADVRGLVHGVMPALLVERGLFAAVEDLVDRVPVPASFTSTGSDDGLPAVVETNAYFVAAEALGNAVKHAGASRLLVSLDRSDRALTLTVEDDGCGGARPGGGAGLVGMADRVGVVGGRLSIDSRPGGGTRIRAEVPCAS